MILSVFQPERASADLSDITTSEILRRGYEEDPSGEEFYVLEFADELTADQKRRITVRLTTASGVEENLTLLADGAIASNRDFRQNVVPQLSASTNPAIRALAAEADSAARQRTMLIRLSLRMLDAED
jgi:hypothetical protein